MTTPDPESVLIAECGPMAKALWAEILQLREINARLLAACMRSAQFNQNILNAYDWNMDDPIEKAATQIAMAELVNLSSAILFATKESDEPPFLHRRN